MFYRYVDLPESLQGYEQAFSDVFLPKLLALKDPENVYNVKNIVQKCISKHPTIVALTVFSVVNKLDFVATKARLENNVRINLDSKLEIISTTANNLTNNWKNI
jgi:hypothetical protein